MVPYLAARLVLAAHGRGEEFVGPAQTLYRNVVNEKRWACLKVGQRLN
jgi:hypothetical protein